MRNSIAVIDRGKELVARRHTVLFNSGLNRGGFLERSACGMNRPLARYVLVVIAIVLLNHGCLSAPKRLNACRTS